LFGPTKLPIDRVLQLPVDAFETIRLIDYEGKDQEMAAVSMGVARTTVQRLYSQARKIIGKAIVEGAHIEIQGGEYVLNRTSSPKDCGFVRSDHTHKVVAIAIAEQDVAEHFGKSKAFWLCRYEEGVLKRKDIILPDPEANMACRHYMQSLLVQTIIAGGMGEQALKRYHADGFEVLHGAGDPAEVLKQYEAGALKPLSESDIKTNCHGKDGDCEHDEAYDPCCHEQIEEDDDCGGTC
ncbi:MAG: DUF134 domain-containing protein, partial [Acholeplasmatales bacterium]